MMEELVVVDRHTGKRYRVGLKRGIGGTTVAKLKYHLENHTNRPARDMVLEWDGAVLDDHRTGASLGLYSGAVLTLTMRGAVLPPPPPESAPPTIGRLPGHDVPPPYRPPTTHSSSSTDSLDQYRNCRCSNCRRQLPDTKTGTRMRRKVAMGSSAPSDLTSSSSDSSHCAGSCSSTEEDSLSYIYRRHEAVAREKDVERREATRKGKEELSELERAYTNIVKQQEWLMHGDVMDGGQNALERKQGAYRMGTGALGLGVASYPILPAYCVSPSRRPPPRVL